MEQEKTQSIKDAEGVMRAWGWVVNVVISARKERGLVQQGEDKKEGRKGDRGSRLATGKGIYEKGK